AISPDRRLVDVDHHADVLAPVHPIVLARQRPRVHQPLPQGLVQDFFDECALARPGRPGDRHHHAERDGHFTALRLFSLAPRITRALPLPFRRTLGVGIDRLPARNCPVGDRGQASRSLSVPWTTTVPPCTPGPGPISTTWSAARIVSSSCSTTITVLPTSR